MATPTKRKPKDRWEHAMLLLKKARKHAKLAKQGIDDNEDDITVTFLFQAYENAVRAAAKSTGEFADTSKHWDLQAQAQDLAHEGFLQTDASDRLEELNDGRKKSAYGYEEEFEHSDFTQMTQELEQFFAEVDELIARRGKRLT